MSVVSSRVSNISSILKAPGARSTISGIQKKITFRIPPDLKNVLKNLEDPKNRTKFEELKTIIRSSQIKNEDFINILNEVRECIPILKPQHTSLIEVLLDFEWRTLSQEATSLYKKFIDDLMDVHSHYYKFVIDKLIIKLKPVTDSKDFKGIQCPQEELEKLNHIHDIFKNFLKNRPMSSEIFMSSLTSAYPHYFMGTYMNKVYLFALLQITEYAPLLRRDILFLIIKRLTTLDLNIPRSEIQKILDTEEMDEDIYMNEEMDSASIIPESLKSEQNKSKVDVTRKLIWTLDICMEMVFNFIEQSCYEDGKLHMDKLKSLFHDLIYCFDNIILPTYACHHVQFIMFYICGFKSSVLDAFVRFLWIKFSNPNTPCILRQYAISYISSLLARFKQTPLSLLHDAINEMANWIHSYIQQNSLQVVNNDRRVHKVFYSICQSMFYLIAYKHRELTDGKRNLMFLQNLQLTKIVTCKLNPLKVCQSSVVQNFATVTRNYQLAYCYTIIERNRRMYIPMLNCNSDSLLQYQDIFPFDPYLLEHSVQRIRDYYYEFEENTTATSESVKINSSMIAQEYDEDDFMDESFSLNNEQNKSLDKFSYSSSPGFYKSINPNVNSQALYINKEY